MSGWISIHAQGCGVSEKRLFFSAFPSAFDTGIASDLMHRSSKIQTIETLVFNHASSHTAPLPAPLRHRLRHNPPLKHPSPTIMSDPSLPPLRLPLSSRTGPILFFILPHEPLELGSGLVRPAHDLALPHRTLAGSEAAAWSFQTTRVDADGGDDVSTLGESALGPSTQEGARCA